MKPGSLCFTGMLLCLQLGQASLAGDGDLQAQITRLSREQGFEIRGLERLVSTPTDASLIEAGNNVRLLLHDYDYVLEHRADGTIERLLVLGMKRPAPSPPVSTGEVILATQRRGEHHLVNATLEGPNGEKLILRMMVDTGASLIVLPSSTGKILGLDKSVLESRELQTANGKVKARIARLKTLQLGSLSLNGVETAVVADEDLGGTALLGMNVLSRYLFILDDEHNQLVLIPDQ